MTILHVRYLAEDFRARCEKIENGDKNPNFGGSYPNQQCNQLTQLPVGISTRPSAWPEYYHPCEQRPTNDRLEVFLLKCGVPHAHKMATA